MDGVSTEPLKIYVQCDRLDRHAAFFIRKELAKRNMLADTPGDIVFNIDSIHNTGFVKGGKLTLYMECDTFMSLGSKTDYYSQADILYINGAQYLHLYPEGAKSLYHGYDPEYHKPLKVPKLYDYVFVGSLEPLPVYENRIRTLGYLSMTPTRLAIFNGAPEHYTEYIGMGHIVLNILPEINGNICPNLKIIEAMGMGCLMMNYHPDLDHIAEKNVHYLPLDRFHTQVSLEEVEKISEASRKLVMEKYTYEKVVDIVLADIKERL